MVPFYVIWVNCQYLYPTARQTGSRSRHATQSGPLQPAKQRVVVGVFSNAHRFQAELPIREAYRASTKQQQALPYELSLFFFVGREASGVQAENATNGDILQGQFAENINAGKTWEWLSTVCQTMDAHWIIKMDQDTAVKWPNLAFLVSLKPPVYFGTRVLEWGLDLGVSPVMGIPPPSNPCRDFAGECWFYMSGGFYGMSMDVARALTRCDYAVAHKEGIEDATTGSWMHHCAPAVRAVDLPMGFMHFHYVVYKGGMEDRIREQTISLQALQQSPTTTVSVFLVGRLGNQLFQAASSFGIAEWRRAAWCLPQLEGSILQKSVTFLVQPTPCTSDGVKVADEQGGFLQFQQWMMRGEESVRVGTYLQSYRYFASSGLPFRLKGQEAAHKWVADRQIQIGIHIRRTDQLTEAHGAKDPGVGYFKEALRRLGNAGPAVVCTDDVAWVRSQPLFEGMHIRDGSAEPFEVTTFYLLGMGAV